MYVYWFVQGEPIGKTEATEAFFAMTKLFQSRDVSLSLSVGIVEVVVPVMSVDVCEEYRYRLRVNTLVLLGHWLTQKMRNISKRSERIFSKLSVFFSSTISSRNAQKSG